MILFLIKTYRTLRRALAARQYPHQLAWAVALGLLLGLIPHGNLLAVATVIFILCLRINHPAMGLTALGVTFVATKMDPVSHRVGHWVLENPTARDAITTAWAWPLVPWTDINNTVVVGSFLIGVALLLPTFLITFPLFKMIMPKVVDDVSAESDVVTTAERSASPTPIATANFATPTIVDVTSQASRETSMANVGVEAGVPHDSQSPNDTARIDFREIGPPAPSVPIQEHRSELAVASEPRHRSIAASSQNDDADQRPPMQTRIDVVRVSPATPPPPHADRRPPHRTPVAVPSTGPADTAAMDEALNYLLHQLRDKTANQQKGDAA